MNGHKPNLRRPRQVEAPDPYSERVRSERAGGVVDLATAVLHDEPRTYPDSDDEAECEVQEARAKMEKVLETGSAQKVSSMMSGKRGKSGILSTAPGGISGRVAIFTSKLRSTKKKGMPKLTSVSFANDGKPLEIRTFEVILPIIARKRAREGQRKLLEKRKAEDQERSSAAREPLRKIDLMKSALKSSAGGRSVTPSQKSEIDLSAAGILFGDEESDDEPLDIISRPVLASDCRKTPRTKPNTNPALTTEEIAELVRARREEVRSIERERFELRTSREARKKMAEEGFVLRQRFTPGDVALRRKVGHIASIDRKWTVAGDDKDETHDEKLTKCLKQYTTKLLADELELEQMPQFERRLAADTVIWCVTEAATAHAPQSPPEPAAARGLPTGGAAGQLPMGGAAAGRPSEAAAKAVDGTLAKLSPLPPEVQVEAGVELVRARGCGCFGGARLTQRPTEAAVGGEKHERHPDVPVVFNIKGFHIVLDTLELSITASCPEAAHARAVALAIALKSETKLRRFARKLAAKK